MLSPDDDEEEPGNPEDFIPAKCGCCGTLDYLLTAGPECRLCRECYADNMQTSTPQRTIWRS